MAEKEQESAPAGAKPRGAKKIIIALIVALLLGGGGAGAYFYMKEKPHTSDEAKSAKHEEEPVAEAGPPVVVPLDIFTANLQPADSEKYLQVGIALKFAGGKEGGGEHGGGNDALKPYISDIRNAVLTKMAELKPEDVTGNIAREQLRGSIKAAIEKVLPASEKKKFKDVLFTQFVVQ